MTNHSSHLSIQAIEPHGYCMTSDLAFESILVRNRLGQGINLLIRPISVSPDHVCVIVKTKEKVHSKTIAKNADYFISQMRQRFQRTVKHFTMIELRKESAAEVWYSWKFNWAGQVPLNPSSKALTIQQMHYYSNLVADQIGIPL